jgi:hypothetical protein
LKPFSADWGWGLLAGILLGFALAMIFVEPEFITPESKAKDYVAIGGIVGATLVVVVRNWLAPGDKPTDGQGQK